MHVIFLIFPHRTLEVTSQPSFVFLAKLETCVFQKFLGINKEHIYIEATLDSLKTENCMFAENRLGVFEALHVTRNKFD